MTEDLVGVNGIDPARQGIDPIRNGINPFYQVYQGMEERTIGVSTGQHGWHKMYQLNPWRTGRMPLCLRQATPTPLRDPSSSIALKTEHNVCPLQTITQHEGVSVRSSPPPQGHLEL